MINNEQSREHAHAQLVGAGTPASRFVDHVRTVASADARWTVLIESALNERVSLVARLMAVEFLGIIRNAGVCAPLVHLLDDPHPAVRTAAFNRLCTVAKPRVLYVSGGNGREMLGQTLGALMHGTPLRRPLMTEAEILIVLRSRFNACTHDGERRTMLASLLEQPVLGRPIRPRHGGEAQARTKVFGRHERWAITGEDLVRRDKYNRFIDFEFHDHELTYIENNIGRHTYNGRVWIPRTTIVREGVEVRPWRPQHEGDVLVPEGLDAQVRPLLTDVAQAWFDGAPDPVVSPPMLFALLDLLRRWLGSHPERPEFYEAALRASANEEGA